MISGKIVYWTALAVAVLANTGANTALKMAVEGIGTGTMRDKAMGLIVSPSFWLGCGAAFLLLVAYLIAIRGLTLSTAYPVVTTLALVALVLVDKFLFGYSIGATKSLGLGLIVIGVGLVYAGT